MRAVHAPRAGSPLAAALALGLLAGAGPSPSPDSTGAAPSPFRIPAARAWLAGAVRPDRLQHVSLAFSFGVALGIASREPAAAAGGGAALGLAKELVDGRHGRFDPGDLLASLAGSACAALAVAALER